MTYFVQENEKGQSVFKTALLDPSNLSVLNSDMSLKIVEELAKKPQCAMDVARRLKQHEQKVYYHIRKLEKAGVISLSGKEERVGAMAKIYSVNSPYLSVKLYDGGELADVKTKPGGSDFFRPFVNNGKLNATIIIGSPDPHGKYGVPASDGSAAIDLALLLGTFLDSATLNYKLDTEIRDEDLKGNLILIGGPKANMIIDKMNNKLPVFFDPKREFDIFSTYTKSTYSDDHAGIVVKTKNPYNPNSQVLLLSGRRFRGTRAAIISVLKYMKKVRDGLRPDGSIVRVVKGIDRDSDGKIDDVEFIE